MAQDVPANIPINAVRFLENLSRKLFYRTVLKEGTISRITYNPI